MGIELAPADVVRADRIRRRERTRLARLGIGHEIVLTGGSSVPGALTGGDVDLHLRVPARDFARVVAALGSAYEMVHPQIWTASLATFAAAGSEAVGIAVTPIDSEHDRRFRTTWERLASDAALLEAYNALKRRYAGGDTEEYRAAKSRFFDELSAGH